MKKKKNFQWRYKLLVNKEMERLKIILDGEFERLLKSNNSYKNRILETIRYSIFSGGKRIRPILALKSFEIFSSGDYKDVMPYALAIEMIHTYSLIHDDLPAMDNDDFRRGKPSNHKKFGEAMAILAGDGLLNMAFETILDSMDSKDSRKVLALREIAKYSGISGMVGGQVVDLYLEEDKLSEEALIYMYKNKTAGLIQAALVAGSLVAGANEKEIEAMREFGYNLGMSYQIQDDFLDLEEDRKIGKITYIAVFGEDKAREDLKKYNRLAIESLEKLNRPNIDFFLELVDKLGNREI